MSTPSLEDQLNQYQRESTQLLTDLTSNQNIEEKKKEELLTIVSGLDETLKKYQGRITEIHRQEEELKTLQKTIEEDNARITELEGELNGTPGVNGLNKKFSDGENDLERMKGDLERLQKELEDLEALPPPS